MKCPKCDHEMRPAFCNRAAGLSCTDPSKFNNYVFKDHDLSKAGFRKWIPWKGEWHVAHICTDCSLYTIEYGKVFSRKEVAAIIAGMKQDP